MLTSSYLPLLALALFLPAATPEPSAPLSPRATIGHYNGNLGINTASTTIKDPTGRPQYLTNMTPISEVA